MVLPFSNDVENFSDKPDHSQQTKNNVSYSENENWDGSETELNEDSFEEQGDSESRDFSQNQISLTFSWSLMNQLRYLARNEGIDVTDLLVELVTEGVTKRAFEDQNKPAPSHLMTRNGYVHNSNDGNSAFTQPQMSHHSQQNGNRSPNRKPVMQQRNSQYNNNSPRYQGQQNRNYQGNNRQNTQGGPIPFRQNSGSNSQTRYNSRSSANQPQNHSSQSQRFEDNETLLSSPKNKKY